MERSERFKQFLEDARAGKYSTPFSVPPTIFQDPSWLTMGKKEYFEVFAPTIETQVRRAATQTAMYSAEVAELLAHIRIETPEDFYHVPALVKDASAAGTRGLRTIVAKDKYASCPKDIPDGMPVTPFYSGGTKGVMIPTWITTLDRQIETHAFAMLMRRGGIAPGSLVAQCYNMNGHKGGVEVVEALELLGTRPYPPKTQFRAPEIIKELKELQKPGGQTVLITIPHPEDGDKQQKGAGRSLGDFVEADAEFVAEKVDLVLLGGNRMTPRTLEWLDTPFAAPTFAIYGATEVLPLLYNYPHTTGGDCTRNTMHLLNGPHLGEIVKYESGELVPVKTGERGMVAVTSVFRQGTPYVRFLIGDGATQAPFCQKHPGEEIWQDIWREDVPSDILAGCAGD